MADRSQLSLFLLVTSSPVTITERMKASEVRFAGHETFACRATWLHKGLNLIDRKGLEAFTKAESVVDLGVGRNMVLAVRYWVNAFGLIDDKGKSTSIARLIVETEEGAALDPFLESRDSLWLLHFALVKGGYGTLYPFFFKEFFKRKSSRFFTESEVLRNLISWLKENQIKILSERSLKSDLRVLIDNYCLRGAGQNAEESMTNILIDLNLIRKTTFKSEGEVVYELNHLANKGINEPLFACLLMQCFDSSSQSLDNLYEELGHPLVMDREAFIRRIEQVCLSYPELFVYKDDAGLREVQCYAGESPLTFLANHNPELSC